MNEAAGREMTVAEYFQLVGGWLGGSSAVTSQTPALQM
jgi:hypothetical protein